jgi:L-alanine-DL-glutamate epimerase-like enolase superfamily enzyme
MQITFRNLELIKRHPLRISRGESGGSTNLLVSMEDNGVTGIGEAAPIAADFGDRRHSDTRHRGRKGYRTPGSHRRSINMWLPRLPAYPLIR